MWRAQNNLRCLNMLKIKSQSYLIHSFPKKSSWHNGAILYVLYLTLNPNIGGVCDTCRTPLRYIHTISSHFELTCAVNGWPLILLQSSSTTGGLVSALSPWKKERAALISIGIPGWLCVIEMDGPPVASIRTHARTHAHYTIYLVQSCWSLSLTDKHTNTLVWENTIMLNRWEMSTSASFVWFWVNLDWHIWRKFVPWHVEEMPKNQHTFEFTSQGIANEHSHWMFSVLSRNCFPFDTFTVMQFGWVNCPDRQIISRLSSECVSETGWCRDYTLGNDRLMFRVWPEFQRKRIYIYKLKATCSILSLFGVFKE